ncbi:hypothetical protein HQQ81_17335 [Microbacteriaceae bacterium VKM Ac-2854]|nr:hypothetical protein [Microbacteriaceae bacterium VKM Ac-2854]
MTDAVVARVAWLTPFVLISAAIACARAAPVIGHGLIVTMLALAGLTPVLMLGSTSWPAYLGVAIAVGLAAASSRRPFGWPSLGLGLLYAAAIGWLMVWRYAETGESIVAWSGIAPPVSDPVMRQMTESTFAVEQAAYPPDVLMWTGVVVFAVSSAVIVLLWALGFTVRAGLDRLLASRAEVRALTERDDAATRLAVAEERGRIARDLHDVLAHSLTVVVVQADGLRRLTDRSPDRVDAALETIAEAARSAIGDIRLVVESLRAGRGEAGEPTVVDLDGLISQMSEQGLLIERSDFGSVQPLGAGAQLAVYRIVQESLTNALAHGGIGSSVRVGLDWRGPGLALTVVSKSGGAAPARTESGGNGIPGMRERASIVGGWLTAGADDDGEFRVSAFVPFVDVSRETSNDGES